MCHPPLLRQGQRARYGGRDVVHSAGDDIHPRTYFSLRLLTDDLKPAAPEGPRPSRTREPRPSRPSSVTVGLPMTTPPAGMRFSDIYRLSARWSSVAGSVPKWAPVRWPATPMAPCRRSVSGADDACSSLQAMARLDD